MIELRTGRSAASPSTRRPACAAPAGAASRWLARVLWWLCAAFAICAQAQPQILMLDAAEAVAPSGVGAPPDWSRSRAVRLPHDWDADWPGPAGLAIYRFGFDAPATGTALLGLYIERACNTLAVRLNGQAVHVGGRLTEPVSRRCHQPQLAAIARSLLLPAGNVIEVTVRGYAPQEVAADLNAGGLSPLRLGPYEALASEYERRIVLGVRLPEVLGGTLVLMGGFMFLLGWFHRRQSYLAYFGALMVGWALLQSRLWLVDLPWPNRVTELMLAALAGPVAMVLIQFLMRYANRRLRWLDVGLPLQCAVMALSLLAASPSQLHAVATAWHALLALEAMAAAVLYLVQTASQHRRQTGLMGSLFALVGLAFGVEWLAANGQLDAPIGQLAQLVPSLAMIAMGMRLVQQYGYALMSAEAGRAELEVRIREATAQIERNFAQLAELKVEQVTARERKRIAADLHDDLGAKLLTIVHTSESERISTLAREALEEMRLSVRGLTGKPVRLSDALGDWRAEVVSRLTQSGIEADWNAPSEDDAPQTLSARAFVQTTRILREAVSNIIKHSGASRCSVRCSFTEGDFQLVVQDNGHGIPIELDGHLDKGHGMASMKGRAKQLQGQCLVESGPGYGTVIRLTLPLDRHVTPT